MIIIDNKRLIPAPLITFSQDYNLTGDGRKISPNINITLQGKLLANMGSPYSNGNWYTSITGYPANENFVTDGEKFGSILSKQETLKELFSDPGVLFQYGVSGMASPVSGFVKMASISFQPGNWVDTCDYTVNIVAEFINKYNTKVDDNLETFANLYLSQANNQISITQDETGASFNVSQNISAVGKASYSGINLLIGNKEPWENAKTWVVSQANDQIITNLINTTGAAKFNKRLTENIDKKAGSYSLDQSFVHSSGNTSYVHVYDVTHSVSRSQIDDLAVGQLLTDTVSINGNIIGLYPSGLSSSGRLAAARTYYTSIEDTIPALCGLPTGFLFANKTYSENQAAGAINYGFTYNNYPNSNTYTHTYSIGDNRVSNGHSNININGVIQGLSQNGSVTGAFTVATGIWKTVKNSLSSTAQGIIGSGFVAQPVSLALGWDKSNGRVTYNAVFNYVEENNDSSANYSDNWEVSLNDARSPDGSTISSNATLTINGSIIGFALNGSSRDRYNNAKTRFDAVKPTLKNRLASVINPSLVSDRIISRSETHNKLFGAVNYAYTFSTRTDISDSGIVSENVVVDTQDPKDVFAVQIIPGLAAGPIIQNIGTITERRKTLSVNWVIDSTGAMSTPDARFAMYEGVYAPTGIKYVENSNRTQDVFNGTYSRTKTWVY